jgi:hypothetical protein
MARSAKISQDPVLLRAALEGFELQRQRIDEQISQLRTLLRGRTPQASPAEKAETATDGNGTRRKLSAAARKRIAAAQKKRWAEFRKNAPAAK